MYVNKYIYIIYIYLNYCSITHIFVHSPTFSRKSWMVIFFEESEKHIPKMLPILANDAAEKYLPNSDVFYLSSFQEFWWTLFSITIWAN